MPDTLADLVRKRYPGKYDSLDDDTLEDKFVKRYPGKYEHLMPPKRNAPPDALKVDNPDVDTIVADARKSAFGRSVPEEGLDAAGQPKFTIDDMPQAEKPKQYETVGPPLPQAKNEQTPTAAPPSNHSAILDFADSVSRFLNNHPRVQEALTGTSPEFEAMKKSYGITDVKGPGFMRIPGLSEENVNKAAQAVTGESGNVRLGLGALTKALGDMAAVAFDPRATVPERTPSPPHNTFDVPYTVHPDEPPPASGNTFQPTSPVPVRQPPIESRFQPPAAEAVTESRFSSVEQPPTIDAAVSPRTPRSTEIPYRMEPQAPPEEGLPVRQQTQQTVTEAPIQRFMRDNPEASMSDIEKFIRSMSATQSAQQGIQPQVPQQDLPVRAEDPFTAGATENRTDIIPQPGGPEFAPTDAIAAPEDQAAQPKADPEENIYTQAINKFNMGKPLPTAPKVQASDLRPDAPYVPVSPFKTVEPQAPPEIPESAPIAKVEPPTATHIGSQPTAEGGAEDLFNIESGPDKGSTVTRTGLEQRGIPVPTIDQSKQGKSGEQLRAEALATQGRKSAFAKPEKAPESTGLAPALPDESVMDYHNRTGASIADSEKATGNAPEEEPAFARSEKGGLKTGVNIRRHAEAVTTGYSGPLEGIMMREGMQNAIDAVRKQGGSGKIETHLDREGFTISDNGKGMTQKELETVFSDLDETGKLTDTGATGGKGIGKASYQRGGKEFTAETVVFEGGKKIKRTVGPATPAMWDTHVPITEEEVPWSTPTGTKIAVKFKEDQYYGNAMDMLQKIHTYSRGVQASLTKRAHGLPARGSFETGEGDKKIGEADIEGNNVTILIPKDDGELGSNYSIGLKVLNNGMFQYSDSIYLGDKVDNMPANVIVNIKPTAEEGTEEYPFLPSRESIKTDLSKKIEDYIKEKVVNPEQNRKKYRLRELYQAMTELPAKGVRDTVFYDPGDRLTPDEKKKFENSAIINGLTSTFDSLIDDILKKTNEVGWMSRLERVGIVLDPGMHGVHVPNPETKKSAILLNPFQYLVNGMTAKEAALEYVITALHEVAHIGDKTTTKVGANLTEELNDPRIGRYLQAYLDQTMTHGGADLSHDLAFVKRLGQVFSQFGPKRTFSYADRIERIIGFKSGQLNPETQELLSIYKSSRGRGAVSEDLLLPTGAKQATKRGGKGSDGRDSEGSGEGTTSGAISRAVANLMEALESVRDTIGEQQEINRSERASRFKNFERTKGGGIDWASKAFSKMKGEHEKADYFSEKQLSKKDVNTLFSAIKNAKVPTQEKVRAVSGMFKILNGDVPVQSEVNVLDDIFGGGFRDKIVQMHGGLGGFGPIRVKLAETANTMKAMKSMLDVSAALRQGAGLALSPGFSKNGIQFINPAYRDAFQMMFKFFYDKKAYNAAMQAIIDDPDYIGARRAGLFLAKPGNLIKAEEAFGKNLIGYLPRWSGVPVAEEASERAYTGFLNMLRFQTYKNLIKNAKDAGHVMEKTKQLRDKKGDFKLDEDGNVKTTSEPTKIAKDIAYYINVTTGRGSLGKLEKIVPELNVVLWSPRNVSSRLTMLNPMYYKGLSNFARFEAMKSLFSIAAIATTLLALAKLRGAKISGNVLSADFGKARMPPSDRRDAAQIVVDPYTGLQQVVVAAARLTAESHRMVTGGKRAYNQENLLGIAGNFLANKESPIASFAHDLATAQSINFNDRSYVNKYGQKKNINPEIANTIMPMIIQDATDVFKSDAKFADQVGLDAVSLLGVGVQNYPETKPQTSKFRKMSIPNR